MNDKQIEKTVSDLQQRVENLERQNSPAQPTDEQVTMDAAQDAHEAALTSFQTEKDGPMNLSANEAQQDNPDE